MPVIQNYSADMGEVEKHATPLVHTANDVVEMALEALDAQARKRGTPFMHVSSHLQRKRSTDLKPQLGHSLSSVFESLLEALFRQGGKAYSREIREIMEQTLAPVLGDADYELVSNGQPRWWNSICSMRNQLIADGLLPRRFKARCLGAE